MENHATHLNIFKEHRVFPKIGSVILLSSFREGIKSIDPISRANKIKSLPNLRHIRHIPPPSILIYNRDDTSYVREQYVISFIKVINLSSRQMFLLFRLLLRILF